MDAVLIIQTWKGSSTPLPRHEPIALGMSSGASKNALHHQSD